ncbi:Membrane-associated tyrosine- and threonine-specific cdc2-inhibitory kinase [Portunus trituberculatus]|uniref:Membrane-associated tyrosine-and threonine-specific cdc2-inhibitory kinase n=1 Tax=Portunus trituberculatus TaxID=210409 RepID=A0A5B7HYB0_PORTR|nr:Membrane-associated tyrosine- and threonine-specific cdc2-inhibitory kinase [Portunus trituberculatus]
MVFNTFQLGKGRQARREAQLDLTRRVLRQMGVARFPDGMMARALQHAPVLGSGTFGTCYRVQVYAASRPVHAAAKVFHGGNVRHALREASAYTRLADVPGVPRLLGVSVAPLCVVTTLHGPNTLMDAALCSGTPAVDLLAALHQVAGTVAAVHERSLVHNDLKFDNVLVSRAARTGALTATLIDLGAVQHVGARPYRGRNLSPDQYPYLAPEVLAGGPVSPGSDAFSLGWMLSGVVAMLPSSSRLGRGKALARHCMHPDPAQRPSVPALRDAIGSLLLSTS